MARRQQNTSEIQDQKNKIDKLESSFKELKKLERKEKDDATDEIIKNMLKNNVIVDALKENNIAILKGKTTNKGDSSSVVLTKEETDSGIVKDKLTTRTGTEHITNHKYEFVKNDGTNIANLGSNSENTQAIKTVSDIVIKQEKADLKAMKEENIADAKGKAEADVKAKEEVKAENTTPSTAPKENVAPASTPILNNNISNAVDYTPTGNQTEKKGLTSVAEQFGAIFGFSKEDIAEIIADFKAGLKGRLKTGTRGGLDTTVTPTESEKAQATLNDTLNKITANASITFPTQGVTLPAGMIIREHDSNLYSKDASTSNRGPITEITGSDQKVYTLAKKDTKRTATEKTAPTPAQTAEAQPTTAETIKSTNETAFKTAFGQKDSIPDFTTLKDQASPHKLTIDGQGVTFTKDASTNKRTSGEIISFSDFGYKTITVDTNGSITVDKVQANNTNKPATADNIKALLDTADEIKKIPVTAQTFTHETFRTAFLTQINETKDKTPPADFNFMKQVETQQRTLALLTALKNKSDRPTSGPAKPVGLDDKTTLPTATKDTFTITPTGNPSDGGMTIEYGTGTKTKITLTKDQINVLAPTP